MRANGRADATETKPMRLDTAFGNIEPSRRTIAVSLFFAGYAAAALSADAEAIVTPSDGLVIGEIHISGADNYNLPAYVARPEGQGRHPAVIVVNEVFGIHDYIKDTCRRFARAGFVAIAPDYFNRAGNPAPLSDMNAIRAIVQTAHYEQVMGDTAGAVRWLQAQRFVNHSALAITGFCWGGGVVWMAAARFPQLKAAVAWYGPLLPPQPNGFGYEQGRPYPINIAGQLRAPVLGLYGAQDQGITQDAITQMRAALTAHHDRTHSEIVVYPDTGHGFHADYRATYNESDARDGWVRMLAWFHIHGVG
jgi:carboxymethylenebutenolidase